MIHEYLITVDEDGTVTFQKFSQPGLMSANQRRRLWDFMASFGAEMRDAPEDITAPERWDEQP